MVLALQKFWPQIALFVIVLMGAFLRFFRLDELPPGIYPDEAMNAGDAVRAMQTGEYSVFYPANNGREGLFMNLIAFSFRLFGVNIISFRAVSAVIGVLAIFGIYILAKEFLRFMESKKPALYGELFALSSALFLATSFWHINFSRISFRAIFVPMLLCFAVAFTLRMLRTRSLMAAACAGMLWGIGLYTYLAFRMALLIPIFLVGAFVFYMGQDHHIRRRIPHKMIVQLRLARLKTLGVFVAAGAITLFPLALYFFFHPQDIVSRTGGISVFADPQPLLALAKSIGAHLQMFFYLGDGNWRHNIAGQAQLMLPIAIFFAGGLCIGARNLLGAVRGRRTWEAIAWGTLWIWFAALLLPAVLTREGIPHALRSIGLIPVVFLFAGIGFAELVTPMLQDRLHTQRIYARNLLVVFAILLPLNAYWQYFTVWGTSPHVAGAFAENYVRIGEFLNSLPESTPKIIVVNEGGIPAPIPPELVAPDNKRSEVPVAAQTILFVQRMKSIEPKATVYLLPEELTIYSLPPQTIVIPLAKTDEIRQILQENFYGEEYMSENGVWYYKVLL